MCNFLLPFGFFSISKVGAQSISVNAVGLLGFPLKKKVIITDILVFDRFLNT